MQAMSGKALSRLATIPDRQEIAEADRERLGFLHLLYFSYISSHKCIL
jgi:hypothetical protein